VKDDGTVVFDVPTNIELIHTPSSLDVGPTDIYIEPTEEEEQDGVDIQSRPPMNIVILIVGTRGDVQPFVAIGKRFQVRMVNSWY
jgi:sterol 3beta-glucosyltransferase